MSSTETTIPKQSEAPRENKPVIYTSSGSYTVDLPVVGTGHYGHYPFDYYTSSSED